jgi:hypothetical protein
MLRGMGEPKKKTVQGVVLVLTVNSSVSPVGPASLLGCRVDVNVSDVEEVQVQTLVL